MKSNQSFSYGKAFINGWAIKTRSVFFMRKITIPDHNNQMHFILFVADLFHDVYLTFFDIL
jgi:hypothetical protein